MSEGSAAARSAGTHTVDEILDSLIEGVAVFDRALRLEYINQNARFMLQLRHDAGRGADLADAFPREIAAALADPLRSALDGDPVLTHELTSRFPEGTELSLGLSVAPLPSATPKHESVVVTARDLSLSREVGRLQDIALAKDDFFSMVAHELRTPLTSILAYADMLATGFPGTEQDRQEFASIIRSEGQRLARLIDEVLDLSRMEANRLTLNLKPVDLADLLASTVRTMGALASQSGLALEFSAPPGPAMVYGDPERLAQVAANLIGNAIKFTASGGCIKVATATGERQVETSVRDTGIGIPAEDLERVFDKFERVDRPGFIVKGTGLGLPITRGLVERMGGRIWAESAPGAGTTIRFTLPRHA